MKKTPTKIELTIYDLAEEYGTEVKLSGKIRSDQFEQLADFIKEISKGHSKLC